MSKVKIEIKSWLNGSVLFEYESEDATLRKALEAAIDDGANLRDANLRGADLRGTNLSDANLSDANLRGADLRDANLRGADLRGADLRGANLSDADLRGAAIYYSDIDFDADEKLRHFIQGTAIEEAETEMRHRNRTSTWGLIWKNVLRIKSWKLKSTDSSFEAVSRNINAMSEAIADSVKPQGGTKPAVESSTEETIDESLSSDIKVGSAVIFPTSVSEAAKGVVVSVRGENIAVEVAPNLMTIAYSYYIVDRSEAILVE